MIHRMISPVVIQASASDVWDGARSEVALGWVTVCMYADGKVRQISRAERDELPRTSKIGTVRAQRQTATSPDGCEWTLTADGARVTVARGTQTFT
jgi:hypothetical protein